MRLVLLSFVIALGCSRGPSEAHQDSGLPATSHASSSPTSPPAAPLTAEAPAPSRAPLPPLHDPDEDAAHRITEQNLESELDRLEREIQAE